MLRQMRSCTPASKNKASRGQLLFDLIGSVALFFIFFAVVTFLLSQIERDHRHFRVKIGPMEGHRSESTNP